MTTLSETMLPKTSIWQLYIRRSFLRWQAAIYLQTSALRQQSSAASKDNIAPSSTLGAASAQARADRLRNLGMSDSQIDEISMNRKIPENIYVVSPTDGFILSRNISPGVRFERYMEMYTIADLSHVWINAEVFGKDVQAFRPGAAARIILPDTGEVFQARVSDVLPQVDPVTRILKLVWNWITRASNCARTCL